MNIKHHPASTPRRRKAVRGFGLVELMTAVAIIGILSAITAPFLHGMTDKANMRRCQRIAQEFSILSNSATAAGCPDLVAASTVAEAMELVLNGVKGSGVFADSEFRLPHVAIADQNMAAHHLTLVEGVLVYDPLP